MNAQNLFLLDSSQRHPISIFQAIIVEIAQLLQAGKFFKGDLSENKPQTFFSSLLMCWVFVTRYFNFLKRTTYFKLPTTASWNYTSGSHRVCWCSSAFSASSSQTWGVLWSVLWEAHDLCVKYHQGHYFTSCCAQVGMRSGQELKLRIRDRCALVNQCQRKAIIQAAR